MENYSMGHRFTCKEIHRLTSESLDRELTLAERVRLRVHLLLCSACRNFDSQMLLIRRAMRQLTVVDEPDTDREAK